MAKILKNSTASPVDLVKYGVTIPASGSTTVVPQDYLLLGMPLVLAELNPLITNGTVVVNDGTSDLNVTDGLAFVQFADFARANRFNNATNGFISTNVQSAIEEAKSLGGIADLYGDGSDGNVSLSSGTTVLARTMYYNNLTLSGTAVLNPNGYKIYVKGVLTISGSAGIVLTANNGTNGSGQTNGNGGAAQIKNDLGIGLAGQAGVNGGSNNGGVPGNNAGTAEGYGNAGGASGSAGSTGTSGTAGVYTHIPERTVRHDHIYKLDYKDGGQGGAGGAGGAASLLAAGGGGGGGGAGGGVIVIFAQQINNTSSVGIRARGGNGGNGGAAPSGNSRGGGGGGGGGGGQIYLICNLVTALGTLDTLGGTGGTGGAGNGSGAAGGNGSSGSTGHTTVYVYGTNTWTVT